MEKEFNKEKSQEEEGFKNDFVENSNSRNSDVRQQQQPLAENEESYEMDREPNGMDPKTIIEKGYSFQETPDEVQAQSINRTGKEPNGIDPK